MTGQSSFEFIDPISTNAPDREAQCYFFGDFVGSSKQIFLCHDANWRRQWISKQITRHMTRNRVTLRHSPHDVNLQGVV
jgi:hypothetical protein